MNTLRKLLFGALALSALVVATPAEARDHHHHRDYHRSYYGHRYYHSRPVVVYRSGYYRPYYYDYGYRPYGYYYNTGPSFSIAFGGSRWHHSHHHHR